MIDLSGKVFIVTGGNGGIGLGMAEGIAMAGGSLVIWGRKQDKNEAALETLHGSGPGQPRMSATWVTRPRSSKRCNGRLPTSDASTACSRMPVAAAPEHRSSICRSRNGGQ